MPHAQAVALGHLKLDFQPAQVVDRGDRRGGDRRGHVVAGRDGARARDAVEGRLDFHFVEAHAEQLELGLGGVVVGAGLVGVGLRDELLRDEVLGAAEVLRGELEARLGLRELGAELGVVDAQENLPLFHRLALVEQHLAHLPGDFGADLRGLVGRERADELERLDQVAFLDGHDLDGLRAGAGRGAVARVFGGFFSAAGG